jgi:hypothetical protein
VNRFSFKKKNCFTNLIIKNLLKLTNYKKKIII